MVTTGAPSSVTLDAMVMLKIMKHHREQLPVLVTGSLLGLDGGTSVDVSNCFETPAKDDDEYEENMLKQLKKVNADENIVGWYICTYFGSYLTDNNILETQCQYQENTPRAVLVIYDPQQTVLGNFPFKALRVSDVYMSRRKNTTTTTGVRACDGKELTSSSILQHLPVSVLNSFYVDAFFNQWGLDRSELEKARFEGIRSNNQQILEKHLGLLSQATDDLITEQNKLHGYERWRVNQRRSRDGGDKRGTAPQLLDTALVSCQLSNYTKQLGDFTTASLGKFAVLNQTSNLCKTGVQDV
eukprot:GHVR01111519.1.p1 GENE.GHVR01111519.1~~GHVR01111519.1.p1  ORF type:complete len:299 (-),score=75.37 GHVR01111519.1:24-920(-)